MKRLEAQATKTRHANSEFSLGVVHGTPSWESRLADGSKVVAFLIRNIYGQVICERNLIISPAGSVTHASSTCVVSGGAARV
jgi:hypothetical protein